MPFLKIHALPFWKPGQNTALADNRNLKQSDDIPPTRHENKIIIHNANISPFNIPTCTIINHSVKRCFSSLSKAWRRSVLIRYDQMQIMLTLYKIISNTRTTWLYLYQIYALHRHVSPPVTPTLMLSCAVCPCSVPSADVFALGDYLVSFFLIYPPATDEGNVNDASAH